MNASAAGNLAQDERTLAQSRQDGMELALGHFQVHVSLFPKISPEQSTFRPFRIIFSRSPVICGDCADLLVYLRFRHKDVLRLL
jgi:hypothetical protein